MAPTEKIELFEEVEARRHYMLTMGVQAAEILISGEDPTFAENMFKRAVNHHRHDAAKLDNLVISEERLPQ